MRKIKILIGVALLCLLCLIACASCNEEQSVCQHRDKNDDALCDKCGEGYADGVDVATEIGRAHV